MMDEDISKSMPHILLHIGKPRKVDDLTAVFCSFSCIL